LEITVPFGDAARPPKLGLLARAWAACMCKMLLSTTCFHKTNKKAKAVVSLAAPT